MQPMEKPNPSSRNDHLIRAGYLPLIMFSLLSASYIRLPRSISMYLPHPDNYPNAEGVALSVWWAICLSPGFFYLIWTRKRTGIRGISILLYLAIESIILCCYDIFFALTTGHYF